MHDTNIASNTLSGEKKMKLLFKRECENLSLYNSDKMIFKADDEFLDIDGILITGKGISYHVDLYKERYYEKEEKCGTSKPIVPISIKVPYEGVIDDCGFYGYFDKFGNEIIKPQYTCAHDFANGLACVSYDLETNYGFINEQGKLVIPMIYGYAWEFNKYGIVVVEKGGKCFPIDMHGNELYVPEDVELCSNNDYDERFIDFEITARTLKRREGYYDTKTRTYIYDVDIKDILEINNGMDIVIKRNGKLKEVYVL